MTINNSARLVAFVRDQINRTYDPAHIGLKLEDVENDFVLPHKGFYIGLVDSSDADLARAGFMKDEQENLAQSAAKAVNDLSNILKLKAVSRNQFNTSKMFCVVIEDCIYIEDPLSWDQDRNGILFQWGQRYKGFYLPYQINRMKIHKVEILDRVCALECSLISNLWRVPEGLCYRLVCQTLI